ncbi:MAG: type II toxin-antitoxin system VapC family toxin [Rhodospirillaceae bacterium]|nr:type II toxin-antitoxin system VapC family toxin [Rhodospirillaceae bacterium]
MPLCVTAEPDPEIRTGISFLPEVARIRDLLYAAERTLGLLFAGRILPFDSAAARTYAEIAAVRRSAGRPIGEADCQIAAIARSQGMAVATRNIRDFSETGVEAIDPWAGV